MHVDDMLPQDGPTPKRLATLLACVGSIMGIANMFLEESLVFVNLIAAGTRELSQPMILTDVILRTQKSEGLSLGSKFRVVIRLTFNLAKVPPQISQKPLLLSFPVWEFLWSLRDSIVSKSSGQRPQTYFRMLS